MNLVEEAILILSDPKSIKWNDKDRERGLQIASTLLNGKELSYRQRRVVNRIIRKYRSHIPNWDQVEEELIPWVKDSKSGYSKQKQVEIQYPILDYVDERLILYTLYDQAALGKSLFRARWNRTYQGWTIPENPNTIQELLEMISQDLIPNITPDAQEIVEGFIKEQQKRDRIHQEVHELKKSDDVELDLPLKTTLFDHQKKAVRIGLMLDNAAFLMEQGTGKTLAAIGVAVQRYLQGEVQRILIVAPKSVLPEWARQFEEHTDLPYQAVALDMKSKERKQIIEEWEDIEGINAISINYESVWRLEKELSRWKPDMIILDESQKIKNHNAKQARACIRLGELASFKLILTGTPVSQNPLDFFGQYLFLDPNIFGTSFPQFRDRYVRFGGYMGKKIKGFSNLEELSAKAHSIAYRVTKEEALDLPDEISQDLVVELDPKAEKLYNQMMEDSILKLSEETTITAPIAITQVLRLQQIAGGFLKDPETDKVIQVSNSKLNLWKDTMTDLLAAGKKVVVFARFRPEIEAMEKHLKQKRIGHVKLVGGVKDRGSIIKKFQNDPNTKVIIAQISTGGVGITLTAADTAIFYSTGYSLTEYEQAKARIHRIGQTNKVTYIHLISKDTVDEEVFKALQEKRDLARLTVDQFKELIFKGDKKMTKTLDEKLKALREDVEVIREDEETKTKTAKAQEEQDMTNENNAVEEVEEVEVEEVEDTIVEEAVTEEAPKKRTSRRGKKAAAKTDAPKEDEEEASVVKLSEIAEKIGQTPATLRRKLRSLGIEKPGSRWEWPVGHADLKTIVEALEKEEPKEEATEEEAE